MNQKRRYLNHVVLFMLFVLVFAFASFLNSKKAAAASATVGFSTESSDVTVNDKVTIFLNVNTDVTLGDFECNIMYDSTILKFVEGPPCVSGGDGMLRVDDIDASSSWTTRTYVLTFEAIGFGNCELSFAYPPIAYEYESNNAMSVSASSYRFSVDAPPTASTNTNLSAIRISPSTLTPSFDSSVTEYSAIVDSTVSKLIMSATAADSKATVSVEGNQDFVLGTNEVVITVTAESGEQKKYTIHVLKEDIITIEPTPAVNEPVTFGAVNQNGVVTISGTYKYTVVAESDHITIPEGYVKTTIKVDGHSIPVYQLKDYVEDDYLLIILKNQFEQTNLYRFDRFEKTIQRFTGERVVVKENTQDVEYELNKLKKSYEQKVGTKNLIIVILIAFSVILVIGIITLFLKLKNHQEDDWI